MIRFLWWKENLKKKRKKSIRYTIELYLIFNGVLISSSWLSSRYSVSATAKYVISSDVEKSLGEVRIIQGGVWSSCMNLN